MKNLIFLLLVCVFNINFSISQSEADSLYEAGEFKKAIPLYQVKEDADSAYKLGRIYQQLGNREQAVFYLSQSILRDSKHVQAQFQLGKIELSNNPARAFTLFLNLTERFPENATYFYYLGKAQQELGVEEKATESFKTSIALNEDYLNSYYALIASYIKTRNEMYAIKYARDILNKHPENNKARLYLAQAFYNSKLYENAVDELELLIENGKVTDYTTRTIGVAYFESQQYEKSIEWLKKYIEMFEKESALSYFYLSKAYSRMENWEMAHEMIDRSIEIRRPALSNEFLQKATIYRGQRNEKEAFNFIKKAYQENKNDDLVHYQLVIAADEYFKDKKTIIKYYENFIKAHPKSSFKEMAQARLSDLRKIDFMEAKE
ncbi:tetratricopeptide repeat protein [Nonlabens tegetincola]|uniref:tetratricopeptide repeat protein n=1 Tax=Nonlabens tegetincola TaxID=323273 RepID=UPI0005A95E3C|nr:tetratricopeptide repeat protein [Nonlabens tegetincola]